MDFQSSTWTLVPYIYLRPEEYVDISFELLLKHPLAKQLRQEFIDTFVRVNGKDVAKFVVYLNRVQCSYVSTCPLEMPLYQTHNGLFLNCNDGLLYDYPQSTNMIPDSEFYANPIPPVVVNERRSFFHYSRKMGNFFIETYVSMYDRHLYYDEICVFEDPDVAYIEGDANATRLRDIVFHWRVLQYNQFNSHTKCPIEAYDFSTNSTIHLVNMSERTTVELEFGHWDLYNKLINEHNRLSKLDKNAFEAERKRMISVYSSDSISHMRALYKGVSLRSVYDELVETRLEPLLDYVDDLDDDGWLWGDHDITDFPPTTPW